jgi:hypothetical protein
MRERHLKMAGKRASDKTDLRKVFGHPPKHSKMLATTYLTHHANRKSLSTGHLARL